MKSEKELTEPQTLLLLKLYEKPAMISPTYRPLMALIGLDLVRVRHVGRFGSNPTCECSPAGEKLAQEIKERMAQADKACTCGRQWSLKHAPPCPMASPGFAAA